MESVEGYDLYVTNIHDNDPHTVWLTEIWGNPSAHQASLLLDQSKIFIRNAGPRMDDVKQIKLRGICGRGICSS